VPCGGLIGVREDFVTVTIPGTAGTPEIPGTPGTPAIPPHSGWGKPEATPQSGVVRQWDYQTGNMQLDYIISNTLPDITQQQNSVLAGNIVIPGVQKIQNSNLVINLIFNPNGADASTNAVLNAISAIFTIGSVNYGGGLTSTKPHLSNALFSYQLTWTQTIQKWINIPGVPEVPATPTIPATLPTPPMTTQVWQERYSSD